jgi:hypothetical protein
VIEKAVQAMLTTGAGTGAALSTAVGGRIALGSRLQEDALPCVYFDVTADDTAVIGTRKALATVEVRCVADEPGDALTNAGLVLTAMDRSGSFASVTINAVIYKGRTLDTMTIGEGDEHRPSVAVSTFEVLYG